MIEIKNISTGEVVQRFSHMPPMIRFRRIGTIHSPYVGQEALGHIIVEAPDPPPSPKKKPAEESNLAKVLDEMAGQMRALEERAQTAEQLAHASLALVGKTAAEVEAHNALTDEQIKKAG